MKSLDCWLDGSQSFFSGSRPAADLIDAFYVDLTLESLAAVNEAKTKVASNWQSLFDKSGHARRVGRYGKARTFKKIASTFRRSQRVKQAHREKAAAAEKNKPVKTITKKKKSTPLAPALPQHKIHDAGHKTIEHMSANYTRSNKGSTLIMQQMEQLLVMDKAAYPSRPMFGDDGLCRLPKCLV